MLAHYHKLAVVGRHASFMPADLSAVSGWRRYYIPAQSRRSDAPCHRPLQILTLLLDVTLPTWTIGSDGEAINHFKDCHTGESSMYFA
jgi:hypothetical protein